MKHKNNNRGKMTIVFIVGIILLVITAGVLAFLYINNQNKSDEKNQPAKSNIEKISKYQDIAPVEAYKMIQDNPEMVIIDVSPRFEKGHLPKAVNYYIGDGSLDKAVGTLDKTKTYLVYCHVDSASIPGAQKLIDAGFTKVYRLEGNYGPWLDGGYPIEISLKAVNGYSGTASATRSYLSGKFLHTVAMKISDPAAGKFFEGWLVKGESFFSTGKMTKDSDMFTLSYESTQDNRDYKKVVITEETSAQGLDNKPETHVFEGDFE